MNIEQWGRVRRKVLVKKTIRPKLKGSLPDRRMNQAD